MRLRHLCLGVVQVGVCSGIDDQRRLMALNGLTHLLRVGNVQRLARQADGFQTKAGSLIDEAVTHLPFCAADQNPQIGLPVMSGLIGAGSGSGIRRPLLS